MLFKPGNIGAEIGQWIAKSAIIPLHDREQILCRQFSRIQSIPHQFGITSDKIDGKMDAVRIPYAKDPVLGKSQMIFISYSKTLCKAISKGQAIPEHPHIFKREDLLCRSAVAERKRCNPSFYFIKESELIRYLSNRMNEPVQILLLQSILIKPYPDGLNIHIIRFDIQIGLTFLPVDHDIIASIFC